MAQNPDPGEEPRRLEAQELLEGEHVALAWPCSATDDDLPWL